MVQYRALHRQQATDLRLPPVLTAFLTSGLAAKVVAPLIATPIRRNHGQRRRLMGRASCASFRKGHGFQLLDGCLALGHSGRAHLVDDPSNLFDRDLNAR